MLECESGRKRTIRLLQRQPSRASCHALDVPESARRGAAPFRFAWQASSAPGEQKRSRCCGPGRAASAAPPLVPSVRSVVRLGSARNPFVRSIRESFTWASNARACCQNTFDSSRGSRGCIACTQANSCDRQQTTTIMACLLTGAANCCAQLASLRLHRLPRSIAAPRRAAPRRTKQAEESAPMDSSWQPQSEADAVSFSPSH